MNLHTGSEKVCLIFIYIERSAAGFLFNEIQFSLCFKDYRYRININGSTNGLRTPNEGINQINLKIWENVADKICFWPYLNIWDLG